LNAVALRSYVGQIRALSQELGLADSGSALMGQVLALPGVVVEPGALTFQLHDDWPIIERVLGQALEQLQAMRHEEGKAMAQELLSHRVTIAVHLDKICRHLPQVTTVLPDRLVKPVRALLAELAVQI